MHPKWDERRGAQTYGAMTIAKAVNNIYEPQEIFGHTQEHKPAVMTDIELSTDRLSTVGSDTMSISLNSEQIDKRNAVSSINIRHGNFVSDTQRKLVERAVAKYQEFSRNISVIECGFDVTVSSIAETVERFIEYTGLHPCVMIDYAQIIKPDIERRAEAREARYFKAHTEELAERLENSPQSAHLLDNPYQLMLQNGATNDFNSLKTDTNHS